MEIFTSWITTLYLIAALAMVGALVLFGVVATVTVVGLVVGAVLPANNKPA